MSAGGKRKGAGRKAGPARVAITVKVDQCTSSRFLLYRHITNLSQARAFERLVRDSVLPKQSNL
jgi:hypothetical protein